MKYKCEKSEPNNSRLDVSSTVRDIKLNVHHPKRIIVHACIDN